MGGFPKKTGFVLHTRVWVYRHPNTSDPRLSRETYGGGYFPRKGRSLHKGKVHQHKVLKKKRGGKTTPGRLRKMAQQTGPRNLNVKRAIWSPGTRPRKPSILAPLPLTLEFVSQTTLWLGTKRDTAVRGHHRQTGTSIKYIESPATSEGNNMDKQRQRLSTEE